MGKADIYIKKLLALIVCLAAYYGAALVVPFFYAAPVMILVFGLIISRIIGEHPKELFNYNRSETYFQKGGLRDFLRILVLLIGFLHDLVVWVIWGIYQVLLLGVDILILIKTILFWIIHAIIWFLHLLVPFWRLVYHYFIYYLIKWPWWIYRITFSNFKRAYNKNTLRISIIGTLLAFLMIHVFYFLGVLLKIDGFHIVGIVLAMLPIVWVFGEISSVRARKLMHTPFSEIRHNYQNGIESVRSILTYLTVFVVLILIQIGFNLLGWFPKTGIILSGITINFNFVFSVLLLVFSFLVAFGVLIIPTYRLYNVFTESSVKSSGGLLSYFIRRFFQYILSFIPASFFSAFVVVVPLIVAGAALFLTINLKNSVVDILIEKRQDQQTATSQPIDSYEIEKKINTLQIIRELPSGINQQMIHRENLLDNEILLKKEDLKLAQVDLQVYEEETNKQISQIGEDITYTETQMVVNETRLQELREQKNNLEQQLTRTVTNKELDIEKLKIDIVYLERRSNQLPLIFFLFGMLGVLFSGLVGAFVVNYLGHVLYETYLFKNDGTQAYWIETIKWEHEIDSRQPLLSTSLNVILIFTILFLLFRFKVIAATFNVFSFLNLIN